MARTREFDTDAAIEALAETFWAEGYEGAGVAELVESTGVGRASLYGAFGNKKEMFLKASDHYLDNRIAPMLMRLEPGGLDAIITYFKGFPMAYDMMPDRVHMGCMIVNTSTEAIGADPDVAVQTERYKSMFRRAYTDALEIAQERGEIDGSISKRADLLLLATQGLFVNVRSGSSKDEILTLVEALIEQIDTWRVES